MEQEAIVYLQQWAQIECMASANPPVYLMAIQECQ